MWLIFVYSEGGAIYIRFLLPIMGFSSRLQEYRNGSYHFKLNLYIVQYPVPESGPRRSLRSLLLRGLLLHGETHFKRINYLSFCLLDFIYNFMNFKKVKIEFSLIQFHIQNINEYIHLLKQLMTFPIGRTFRIQQSSLRRLLTSNEWWKANWS